MGEAVDLAHAWAQSMAAAGSFRVLFIKGPALHRRGLRTERSSYDVDVLVAPDDFGRACQALERAGWVERDSGILMQTISHHSRTFISPAWPCDMDVHTYFPGFLADPATVFEALWERRETLTFAEQPCTTTDRVSSALILALHSLRSTKKDPRHNRELAELFDASFTTGELAAMAALASLTGSAEALDEVLSSFGIHVWPSDHAVDLQTLRTWRIRTDASSAGPGTYVWLRALRSAPLRRKPAVLRAALWPSDRDLRLIRPGVSDDPRRMNAIRRKRLTGALADLPRFLRALWHAGPSRR